MATIQMYNRCISALSKMERVDMQTKKRVMHPDLSFFGIKVLVDETELVKLGEREKSRHHREDDLLRTLYVDVKV